MSTNPHAHCKSQKALALPFYNSPLHSLEAESLTWSAAGSQQAPGVLLTIPPIVLGSQLYAGLYVGSVDPNSSPHACTASALTNESKFFQPNNLDLYTALFRTLVTLCHLAV